MLYSTLTLTLQYNITEQYAVLGGERKREATLLEEHRHTE